jgi:hypothetical protein
MKYVFSLLAIWGVIVLAWFGGVLQVEERSQEDNRLRRMGFGALALALVGGIAIVWLMSR